MEDLIIVTNDLPKIRSKGKSKRKSVKPSDDTFQVAVTPIDIDSLVLNGTSILYFKRLRYFGVPKMSRGKKEQGAFSGKADLVNMNRDHFIRTIYSFLAPDFNRTKNTHFYELTGYIAWLDITKRIPPDGDYFREEYTDAYMQYSQEQVNQGVIRKGTWSVRKSTISFFLKQLNRQSQASKLLSIKNIKRDTKQHMPLSDEELKQVSKVLFKAYFAFIPHIEQGIRPQIHPLYELDKLEKQKDKYNWTTTGKDAKFARVQRAFKVAVGTNKSKHDWRNQLTRIAVLISFMLTGTNSTPLLKMKRKDVRFVAIRKGHYVFDSEKGRANHQSQDSSMGFSEHTKRFIESWLSISSLIASDPDGYLYPYINVNGEISGWVESGSSPQTAINKLLKYLGYPSVNSSRFRKTKSDVIMRVTQDIYLVSQSMNNSIAVIKSSYSSGVQADHERNLTASMDATFDFAKGTDRETAIETAKYNHHDILSGYDYKKLRSQEANPNESITPQGLRCQDNTQGSAITIKRILEKAGADEIDSDEVICTDFLECFECGNYKLVADVDDIWLMMSFNETLKEMELYPAVNSMQSDKFTKLCNTISAILIRFNEVATDNYQRAQTKLDEAPHPLYSDIYSLNDLIEVFS